MSTSPGPRPVVAIVGATATGKTAVATELARRLGAAVELVSVDAMAVYRTMDLGTAKPDVSERRAARWHLLDLVDPSEEFSVSDFQVAWNRARLGIDARRHLAVLVGGTGLYHRAILDDLQIPPRYPEISAGLEDEADRPGGLERLATSLAALDPLAGSRIEPGNRRRLLRALEVTLGAGRPYSSFGPGLAAYGATSARIVGLRMDRPELDRRVAERFEHQLELGLLEEVRALASRPVAMGRTARQAIGYRELLGHVEGGVALSEAVASAHRRLRSFARRQESWFGRDPRVEWVDATRPDVVEAVIGVLSLPGPSGEPALWPEQGAPAPGTKVGQAMGAR